MLFIFYTSKWSNKITQKQSIDLQSTHPRFTGVPFRDVQTHSLTLAPHISFTTTGRSGFHISLPGLGENQDCLLEMQDKTRESCLTQSGPKPGLTSLISAATWLWCNLQCYHANRSIGKKKHMYINKYIQYIYIYIYIYSHLNMLLLWLTLQPGPRMQQ